MSAGRIPTTANSPLTTKGDLFGYSTAPARLAVGSDGSQLVADSTQTTGLGWAGNVAAGKNAVINGGFDIWQRGTSFSINNSSAYTADRFFADNIGTCTVSQQTFTPGTAPVAGYEGQYFLRFNQTVAGAGYLIQKIEDVRQFAGQTITFSIWAKAAASLSLAGQIRQNFGSGGSSSVNTTLSTQTVGTSWARYTWTVAIPSVAGLTIGTSSFLQIRLDLPSSGTYTFDTWGWQAEAGSTATPFSRNASTIQGELAACQRYYQNLTPSTTEASIGNFAALTSTEAYGVIATKVSMRTAPSIAQTTATDAFSIIGNGSGGDLFDAFSGIGEASTESVRLGINAGIAVTQGYAYWVRRRNGIGGVLALSAEL